MKTTVTRTFRFEAAHQLPWHEGKCRNLHGHSYRLDVTVAGPVGPNGIVLDFADLRAVVDREVVDRYDHRFLNDLMDNPTAELLAQIGLEDAGGGRVGCGSHPACGRRRTRWSRSAPE